MRKNGVNVIVGGGIAKFSPVEGEDGIASVLQLQSGRIIPKAEMTILFIGAGPDTAIAIDAGIKTTPMGMLSSTINFVLQCLTSSGRLETL